MNAKLEKLFFTVGLIDNASGKAGKITAQVDRMMKTTQSGLKNIAGGAAGLAAAGFGLSAMISPALEVSRALGEVRALDVNEKSLGKLSNAALLHSIKYGTGAAEFIQSSYDIQSAIAGLSGNELTSFTAASGVLAKATKSDAATITNYMGTMFGVFKNNAETMGKSKWVEIVAGQTALAVQVFKTTGNEMSAAFTSIGADAQAHGILMHEQMAILGTLQATMSGSEAGTKYKAFLGGVGKAQKTLGLEFVNSQGKMLPMVEILGLIQGKFGAIDTVAKSDLLQKAFGRKEAVGLIKQLMLDTQGLATNINALGDTKGMQIAMKMAKDQTDSVMRLGKGWQALKILLGTALLKVFMPVFNVLANITGVMVEWGQTHPFLMRFIGGLTTLVLGIVTAISSYFLVMGIAKLATVAWGVSVIALQGFLSVFNGVLAVTRGLMIAFSFAAFLVGLPVWAIVAAVAALVAGLVLLYMHWQKIKAAFVDSKAFKVVAGFFGFDGGDSKLSNPALNSGGNLQAANAGSNITSSIASAVSNNQRSVNIENMNISGVDKSADDVMGEWNMLTG